MLDYADLEIGISPHDQGTYKIDMRYTPPGADVESSPEEKPIIALNAKELKAYHLHNDDYGQKLVDYLFNHKVVSEQFAVARNAASEAKVPLRMRLAIERKDAELHSLRWETLYDPADSTSRLLTNPKCVFSRFFVSNNNEAFRPAPKSELKTLVAIANPDNLKNHQVFNPVDVDGELKRAQEGLGDIKITALGKVKDQSQFEGVEIRGQASLPQIEEELRRGCNIFYLACHGVLDNGEAKLWLDPDEADERDYIPGQDLVTRLIRLEQPPLLVILASCQSAGTGNQPRTSDEQGALAALGPQLASAGIPAVLAMQGSITMKTVRLFMSVLFRELAEDGRIDRAVAIARSKVQERPDWWMPVLFMRLKSGQLYIPGEPWEPKPFEPETVRIPGGKFWLGCNADEEGARSYEQPRHRVELPTYYISRYPVTNKEYSYFVEAKNWPAPKINWKGQRPAEDRLNHPVMGVSWYDAMEYCKWLSQESGRNYRLPSETEWEKAARGKNGDQPYPWGDWENGRCNFGGDGATPVDNFAAQNDYDCYDFVGNIPEWTTSLWGTTITPDHKFYYPWDANDQRDDLKAGNQIYRVIRGGSFKDKKVTRLRCGARRGLAPNKTGEFEQQIGFRVILDRSGG